MRCRAVVWTLLFNSAVNVNDSQAYKNTEITRERISLILELNVMFLSFQIGLTFVIAAVVCAILERISGLDPLRETTSKIFQAADHLKLYATDSDVCVDATSVVGLQLSFLGIDMHAVG